MRIEALVQHHRVSVERAAHHDRESAHVVERQTREPARVRLGAQVLPRGHGAGHMVEQAEPHALGPARGAGGEQDGLVGAQRRCSRLAWLLGQRVQGGGRQQLSAGINNYSR